MNTRILNSAITRRVIELQAQGYDHDFSLLDTQLICAQIGLNFPLAFVSIKVVDQAYDRLTHSFKYIHTIDTGNGQKGLMVTEAIVTNGWIS
jgi:hypothetical protein